MNTLNRALPRTPSRTLFKSAPLYAIHSRAHRAAVHPQIIPFKVGSGHIIKAKSSSIPAKGTPFIWTESASSNEMRRFFPQIIKVDIVKPDDVSRKVCHCGMHLT